MKKFIILSLFGLIISLSSYGQISGTLGCCIGSVSYLTDLDSSASGGTWTSSNSAIASVMTTGIGATATVYGISGGIATITYWFGGSAVATASFTVNPAPAAITGATPTCIGVTATLTDATSGGTWSTGNPAVATIDAVTGVVTGVGGGSTNLFYTASTGCFVRISVIIPTITVSDSITGPATLCAGTTITLADATTGGSWSSGSTAIATVSAVGVVAGVSAGATTITYTVSSVCAGSASAHKNITVTSGTSAGTISGASSVTTGATTTLADGVGGGTWSSSNTAIATVNASTGVVTGLAAGTATITYTVVGCSGTATATAVVTVTAFDGISGYVNFTSSSYSGAVKVWLITYNPTSLLLEAVDSTTVSCSGSSVYYQFTGLTTDSFRVKADALDDSGASGYVPTYHTNAYYWHDADVIYHVSGTANTGENINMATGTLTTGPGFVGGNVTSGANRGTSTGAPVEGLLIFLQNSTSGAIVQQTYTNASGNYSFSSLPYGTYFVYPELINYATIPYASITLSAATPTEIAASFIQHTVSKTITPVNEAVNNVKSIVTSVVAYPNPTNGKMNILWNTPTNETGTVSVTDITGREVYRSTIQMTAGSGITQTDLSGLTNGLYLLSVKSANVTYNNKIEIQH